METRDRLKSWLEATSTKPASFARMVDYDKGNFGHVLAGRVRPTIDLAAKIERETNGVIRATDWAQPENRPLAA